MLLSSFIKDSTSSLEHLYPTVEARSIVLMLCGEILGTKSYTHIIEPQTEVPQSAEAVLSESMDRLRRGEPIQYVIGKAEWCGLTFRVTPDVLIPRPETELLCREAIKTGMRIYRMRKPYGKNAVPVRILDLCTGSGCIAWNTALGVTGAQVIGVDISEKALDVARGQDFAAKLKENGASAPKFLCYDVLDGGEKFAEDLGQEEKEFDLILSNPPYIMEGERHNLRRNVLEYEPSIALFVPDDDPLLFYRAIAGWSSRFLSSQGTGLTEINEFLGKETADIFRREGYRAEIIKDFYGKDRFIQYKK